MMMYSIEFLPYHQTLRVTEGENLLRAALQAGIHINASCGGEGHCGKCRVVIEHGLVDGGITEKLSSQDIREGYRLACLCSVKSDLKVRIPVETVLDSSVIRMPAEDRCPVRVQEFRTELLKEEGEFHRPVEKYYLQLPPPTSTDNISDASRLVGFLKRNFGKRHPDVPYRVLRTVPGMLRKTDFNVTVSLLQPICDADIDQVVRIEPGDTTGRHLAVSMDIGTTTVNASLVDLNSGAILASWGEINAQVRYGEDVISRIVHAEKTGGLEQLHRAVIGTVNRVIHALLGETGMEPGDVSVITLAGNTTMTQLLMNIDPAPIRRSPYVPAASLYPPVMAADIGIDLPDHVTALVYPQISSYVGGDIVAGVIASGMYRSETLTLYLDIGTNAEIVIGNSDWLACAACSAGPAFEGGGVTFGMRACAGAIEDFSIDPITLEPMNITIGNVRAKGICGSGLISILAELFEAGVIDSRGKFRRDLDTNRIRKCGGVYEYVLTWREENQTGRDIVITEPDIDNLIRAKGAIYSGCVTLLSEIGLSIDDIGRIILAGGFGSYLDLSKAVTIGLLPEIEPEKIHFIGNGSLLGATMSCLANRLRRDVADVVDKMTNFELSETATYMDNYVASLFLPHTDVDRFPGVKQRLSRRIRR